MIAEHAARVADRRPLPRIAARLSRSTGLKILGLALMFGAWQLYATLSNSRLTPGLATIAAKWYALIANGELARNAATTLGNGLTGLAIAFVAGTLVAFVAANNWVVAAALRPLISLAYPVPKLALYPIIILMLGFGGGSKIAQVALECFFPIFVNSYAGARAVDRTMMWLARNAGAGRGYVIKDIILPAALPSTLTGLRIAAPIMLIVMTVTELIGDSQGLGFLIAHSASYFDSASAFAVVGTLGCIGFIGDRLIVTARRRLVFWEKGISL